MTMLGSLSDSQLLFLTVCSNSDGILKTDKFISELLHREAFYIFKLVKYLLHFKGTVDLFPSIGPLQQTKVQ